MFGGCPMCGAYLNSAYLNIVYQRSQMSQQNVFLSQNSTSLANYCGMQQYQPPVPESKQWEEGWRLSTTEWSKIP